MTNLILPEAQVDRSPGRGSIVLIVMDGLGGLPRPATGKTELETALTPNMDRLAQQSSLGLLHPVQAGITPGSGPAHLSLFGYDPTRCVIGRGALSALGVGIELEPGDVAARLNFASFGPDGRVTDRRAGRPKDDDARRVVSKVMAALPQPHDARIALVPEKEHRVVLHIRGRGLGADLSDTDPLETGRPDLPVQPTAEGSARTAAIVNDFLAQARRILADEPAMNGFLARGWAAFERLPSIQERFGLRGTAIAKYPMYRGVARLVGMTVEGVPEDNPGTVALLESQWGRYDLYFLHFKDTDTRGHDGDFEGKAAAIQVVDALLPRVLALQPDVLILTGDHSTPALYREHSWHGVPTLLASRWARPSAPAFGESACRSGDLGQIRGTDLMPLALAHAGRLVKFGA
jgi:2,3-bisphosphoglycerate-independent phosphoglycerate mutase